MNFQFSISNVKVIKMQIQIDTREKQRAIAGIIKKFDMRGIKHISSKLYVGDYMDLDHPRLVIDRKQNLLEVCSNVTQQHDRFIAEIRRANDAGIKLVFLIEHGGGIKTLDDVAFWRNPRLESSPLAVSGGRLHKILTSIKVNYNVEFLFCDKAHTAERIVEILAAGSF